MTVGRCHKVARIHPAGGKEQWWIFTSDDEVHERSLVVLRGRKKFTQRTYAYSLVDHLNFLDVHGLDETQVRFDHLVRYMAGITGSADAGVFGLAWRDPSKKPLGVSGLALRVWSMRTLGAFYTRTLRTAQNQHVVDTGPYRMIRHPGYTRCPVGVDRLSACLAQCARDRRGRCTDGTGLLTTHSGRRTPATTSPARIRRVQPPNQETHPAHLVKTAVVSAARRTNSVGRITWPAYSSWPAVFSRSCPVSLMRSQIWVCTRCALVCCWRSWRRRCRAAMMSVSSRAGSQRSACSRMAS